MKVAPAPNVAVVAILTVVSSCAEAAERLSARATTPASQPIMELLPRPRRRLVASLRQVSCIDRRTEQICASITGQTSRLLFTRPRVRTEYHHSSSFCCAAISLVVDRDLRASHLNDSF